MRLLDRYLFRELFTPLAYCLGGLVVLGTCFSLFGELAELQERKLRLLDVAEGYAAMREGTSAAKRGDLAEAARLGQRAAGLAQPSRTASIRSSGTSRAPAATLLVQVYMLTRQPHGAWWPTS